MDHPAKIKKQPAAAKKKPTTLLDAYEVECIRRELERLVLKHNHQSAAAAAAPRDAHGHHRRRHDDSHLHRQRVSSARKATSAKRVSPSPSLPPPAPPVGPKTNNGRRGVRLLGRHAVAICSGTVPVSVPGPGAASSRRGRRVVAICSGTTAPVACATVGVGGRRRPSGGGYREVEKV